MALQFSLFSVIYLAAGAIALLLVWYSWQRRSVAGGIYFTLLMLAVSEWSLTLAIEILADPSMKIFWGKLQYVGIVSCAPFWLLFIAGYTRRDAWTRTWKAFTVWIIPVITLALVATNEWHGLVWPKITPGITAGSFVFIYENGPAALFSAAFSYVAIITACTLLVFTLSQCSVVYRRQIWVLLGCTVIVLAGDLIDLAGWNPLPGIDLTPIAFGCAGLLMYEGAIRYRILDLAPVVYENLYRSMNLGVVAVDPDGKIIEVNPAAQHMLSLPADALGQPIAMIVPGISDVLASGTTADNPRGEFSLICQEKTTWLEVSVSPLPDCNNRPYGKLLLFHDVTANRIAAEELRQANNKLGIISSVTGHDILNKLSVLEGYQDLCQAKTTDPAVLAYIGKQRETSEMIRDQIQFMQQYEEVGVSEPAWHNLRRIVFSAVSQSATGQLAVEADTGDVSVYADPLIGRVFSNLIDNTVRHGGHAGRSTVTVHETSDGLVIVYEDDGDGVPEREKEKIFLRGYGSHTGLGLFLIREILSITGISIRENGVEGKGARFEMVVPAGKYRLGTG